MNRKKSMFLFCLFFFFQENTICMNEEIFEAIKKEDTKKIDELLSSYVNVDYQCPCPEKFWWNHTNESNSWYGYTPLIYAVYENKPKIVTMILKYGPNINVKDSCSLTASEWTDSRPEVIKIFKHIESVKKLVRENKIDELYRIIASNFFGDPYLLYYALFKFKAKKQFELFKEECTKNGIFNVDEMLYEGSSPQLLTHFLKNNMWTWKNKMFKKFPMLSQKKDMMIYQYNNSSIVDSCCYDLLINYNNQEK